MRTLILLVIGGLLVATLVFSEKRKPEARVGLGAVMRLVADFQREAERIPLGLTRVSDDEEVAIGAEMASHYGLNRLASSVSPEEQAITEYLNVVGGRIAAHVSRTSISYHFYLDANPGFVNAFALPGGHIVVGRGLLNIMESEDELAAVLGHEVTHVDRRHCIERLQYEIAARKAGLQVPYALASIPIELFHRGYSKELELEADRVGTAFAAEAGYSPQGAIDLFARFLRLEEQMAQPASPAGEISKIIESGLTEYFRSHPPAQERIAEVKKEIATHRWPPIPVRPIQHPSSRSGIQRIPAP